MTRVTVSGDDILRGWWEYHRLADGSREERKALNDGRPVGVVEAKERVDDLVDAGDPAVIDVLEMLIKSDPTESRCATVGAGPLEDLIHDHGDELADDLDARARRSPGFAEAMSFVWLETGTLKAETIAKLSTWVKLV